MNSFLMLCVLLMMAAALLWRFKEEIGRELVFSIGQLQYNPGGVTVPAGYRLYNAPYLPTAAQVSQSYWLFLSGVAASYNTKLINLRRNEADGSYTSVAFQYYNTGGGPSLPIIGINVTGMTTALQIRNATAAALRVGGFLAPAGSTGSLLVSQPFPGTQGDTGFMGDFDGAGLIAVGPSYAQPLAALSIYGNTIFWGSELSVPALIGPIRGMVPVASQPFTGTA